MHEADVAISDKEFVSKLSIVLKESNETWYWMGLMNNEFVVLFDETLLDDLTQIVKIIKYVIGKLKN